MPPRLLSLDFFRGFTVAAMIIVNNPGSWDSVYSPLLHAKWNGCTPTDLIFPFFLFIVGVSIHLAYREKKKAGFTRSIFKKILRRAVIIFLLGMFLAWYTLPLSGMVDGERLSTLRIPGVLQRIALVFYFCSILYLNLSWRAQLRLAAVLLLLYYIALNFIPVPGYGVPSLEPEANLGAWMDRIIFGNHLWAQSRTWDPEGLMSTIPAIATGMLGMLTGQLMDEIENPAERVSWLFFLGGILMLAGLWWDLGFPLNKSLWTSSYVLYTGGLAIQILAASHWIIDINQHQLWTKPFLYFGMNAIFAFVASGLVAKSLLRVKLTGSDGKESSLWSYLYQNFYATWLEPKVASLLFALTFLLLVFLLLRWLYRRKIFVKV